jgi:parallel beta-helix repeat protein
MRHISALLIIGFLVTLSGCTDSTSPAPADTSAQDVGTEDAGTSADASSADSAAPDTFDKEAHFPNVSCEGMDAPCLEIAHTQVEMLFEETNLLVDNTTIVLGAGTFELNNQVTIREANGVSLVGQGIDETILSFSTQQVQSNGIDVIGDDFLLEGLTVADTTKDGVRIEESDGVIIRKVKVTWSGGPATENGAYGLYPVRCKNVLMEDSEAYNASDAGIYIGQCIQAIIRDNIARGNVAGIEIENTQFADVYGNTAEDNTGGLLIFDLPGNKVVGRDLKIHDNIVHGNNRPNFAPSGTVRQVPAGTGTVIFASRRVELYNNSYKDNKTGDIAILSGLAIEAKESKWALDPEELIGDTDGLNLLSDEAGVYNYRSDEIVVHGNTHSGSGTAPDTTSVHYRPIGFLLAVLYNGEPSDSVMYGTMGESSFDTKDAALNSNDNHICVGGNTEGTFASLHLDVIIPMLEKMEFPTVDDIFHPEAPFAPFDCTEFTAGPIPEIVLE